MARCAALALSLLAGCTGSSHRMPPPSTEIDEASFREDVRVLSSEEFEGRRPGTAGEDKTVAFLVDKFRRLGLKPGNGESYLQTVPVIEITRDGDAVLSLLGHGSVIPLRFAKDMVIWSPADSAEATLEGSELVFVGYGIVAPEYHWNDYAQADLRGKTAVVMVGDPGVATDDPRLFRGPKGTRYGRWAYKVEEAVRQGAAGVLVIYDHGRVNESWNALVNSANVPRFEWAASAAARASVEGWLAPSAARLMFKQAGLDFDALVQSAAHPGFKATSLTLQADATLHDTIRRLNSSNVVGVLPGTDHKREYVIYTAHWDHLGRLAAAEGGAVLGGAVDNASGVAGLLMLAQSFARTRPGPDRSIAFIAFTAAESGLLGSAYYTAQPLFPLQNTVAVLNLDSLRIGGPTRDVVVFGRGDSELDDYVEEAALLQGRAVVPDPTAGRGTLYGSDEFSFEMAGVPALYAKGGLDDAARGPIWGREQLEEYWATRYRQAGDTYSADWDVRGTLDDLRLYREVGNRLAHSRRFPRFHPTSEFRVLPPP